MACSPHLFVIIELYEPRCGLVHNMIEMSKNEEMSASAVGEDPEAKRF